LGEYYRTHFSPARSLRAPHECDVHSMTVRAIQSEPPS
jgi:hypothetical protein